MSILPIADEITDSLKKIKILSVPSSSKIVGLALATSVGAEEITLAVGKALAAKGVRNVVVSLVHSATILPYVAKQMAAKCDVILAVGVLETDTANLSQILTTALIETGLRVNCPIIPGMLAPGSLLETKAALSVCLPGWIKSILSLVALGVVHPCLISDLQVK